MTARGLTRREMVGLFGSAAMATLLGPRASGAAPSCVVRPAQTEGPYFVDERLDRSDIRGDVDGRMPRPGVPLALPFTESRLRSGACTTLPGAMVDVWHCDAAGQYSDVRDQTDTSGQKWLRGFQTTDAAGKASFVTIVPGGYQGRAVHIHFKIRQGTESFTSQIYFDEALLAQVLTQPPYNARRGSWLRNEQDGLYRRGGPSLVLPVTRANAGYAGNFDIALQS